MSTLLETLRDQGFQPVGVTHRGSPILPGHVTYGLMELEVYIVDDFGPTTAAGKFTKHRLLDREGLIRCLPQPSRVTYSDQIDQVIDHPEGYSGFENKITGIFSGFEAQEFLSAAHDFNIQRELKSAARGDSRATQSLLVLGEIVRRIANPTY